MKLKLNTKGATAAPSNGEPSATPVAQTPSGGLKLRFKANSTPNEVATKQKRKYVKKGAAAAELPPTPTITLKGPKKRARDDDGFHGGPSKRRVTGGEGDDDEDGLMASMPAGRKLMLPKLKLKAKQQKLRVKAKGVPPMRPIGEGYDSEAEDVEIDPAIEHQFILRMAPGDDCEYLRKAIDEKTLGVPVKEGGADVSMRFLDREGRRAVINVRGNLYAATMVELPCIVEGMKSWDKKGWWKTADICQMLLVFARVQSDEEARLLPLPREVEQSTYQFPHGLTPPMHYARKRRFRKRISYRTIEAVEQEVERLLEEDEKIKQSEGQVQYQVMDLDQLREVEEDDDAEEEGYGDQDAEGEEVDEEDYADEMAAFLEEGEDDNIAAAVPALADATASNTVVTTNGIAHVQELVASETPTATGTPSAAAESSSPAAAAESSDEDEDDDDDDGDEAEEVDEDTLAQQQEQAQQREEIADLEREIAIAKSQFEKQTNPLLKQRLAAKVKSLQADLDLKRGSTGDDEDYD